MTGESGWKPGDDVPDGWLVYACPGEGHDERFEYLTPVVLAGDEACPECLLPVAPRR